MAGQVKVTLVRGRAGKNKEHLKTLTGLGLRKTNHSVVLEDTAAVRGMINKVIHLVSVEDVKG